MATAAVITPENLKAQFDDRYQLLEKRILELESLVRNSIGKSATDSVHDGGKDEDLQNGEAVDDDDDDKDSDYVDSKKADDEDDGNEGKPKAKKRRIRKVNSEEEAKNAEDGELEDTDAGEYEVTFRESPYEVDILPGGVLDLLKATIKEYPSQSWEGDFVNITAPFSPLIHNWQALEEATEGSDEATQEARDDLRELMGYITQTPNLKSYFKTRQSYLDAKITTYETMWSLFVPGKRIYAKPFLGKPQLLTVKIPPYVSTKSPEPSVSVCCWCYEWKGKSIIKAHYDIDLENFRGTKPVSELPCYPLEYFVEDEGFENQDQLLRGLVQRGDLYNCYTQEIGGVDQMFKYDGDALAENRNTLGSGVSSRSTERSQRRVVSLKKGKFIIDTAAFLEYCGGELVLGDMQPCHTTDTSREVKDIAEAALQRAQDAVKTGRQTKFEDIPKDEKLYLALLPPRYLGYSLQNKFWGQFSVNLTSPADKKRMEAFEKKLQLKQEYKDIIKALVSKHDAGNNDNDGKKKVTDIVEGKGKGLVILLHGPPGVGKTLTAETIAEATGKPLFIVSVAEIGLDAAKAEKNLQQMFDLASAWGAILLVDEADVFLEARSSESGTERNALVSVLLRVLEYYHGIMILTTNRIRHLDVAVQSRIHLAVRYNELEKEQKAEIFKYYLNQLEKENIYQRDRIDEWVDEYGSDSELNGRQIRNLVSAALALARNETGDDRVTDKHLKKVLKVVNDFIKDLAPTVRSQRDANEVGRQGRG